MYCPRCGTWTPDTGGGCARCGEAATAATAQAGVPTHADTDGPARAFVAGATAAPAPVAYGGFWRRVAAGLVDSFVLLFPDATLRLAIGVPTVFTMRPLGDAEMGRFTVALCASSALWWLYCALLESSRWQGTLGQQLLDLRVADGGGLRRISFGRATLRHAAQVFSILLCGLGFLFNLWTSRRQTLHDLMAGCVIVRPAAAELKGAPATESAS